MGLLRLLCTPPLSLLLIAAATGQSPNKGAKAATPWPQRTVRFLHEDPVLGLPPGMSRSSPRCSADGRTYFEVSDQANSGTGTPSLYSVTDSGETRLLLRKLPTEYTSLSVRDFFAGEHTLVTLLEAEQRNEADASAPPREVRYFVSLSDHDGDGAALVPLDVRFKPLRVALFGSGDFLLLGWDEVNLMPVLALVKETGVVRRFVDLSGRTLGTGLPAGNADGANRATAQPPEKEAAALAKTSFVPYGNEVLLTFPGTTKSFQVWNAVGESRTLPWSLPGGYVLHDVLVSGVKGELVVRIRPVPQEKAESKESGADIPERLFEISSYSGGLLREFVMEKPTIAEITCAAKGSRLTAIFTEDAAGQADGSTPAADKPKSKQLVISTTPR